MSKTLSVTINGRHVEAEVADHYLLVDFLREDQRLTGTHIGCDTSQCGACTVHLDGVAVKSCALLAVQCQGRHITTIEGLADKDGTLHPVQQAFRDCHGLQCGYCTPGMVMAIVAYLDDLETMPDDTAIRAALEGNLCRCTGYQNIVAAVRQAAQSLVEQPG